MALNKEALKTGILMLLTEMRVCTEVSDEKFAEALSGLIDAYVKSATITVPSGIAVSTTGSAMAQSGATTATATAIIS